MCNVRIVSYVNVQQIFPSKSGQLLDLTFLIAFSGGPKPTLYNSLPKDQSYNCKSCSDVAHFYVERELGGLTHPSSLFKQAFCLIPHMYSRSYFKCVRGRKTSQMGSQLLKLCNTEGEGIFVSDFTPNEHLLHS